MRTATDYLRRGLLPASERAGIRPVGCFNAVFAPDSPFILTLASYPSLAALETAREKLAADKAKKDTVEEEEKAKADAARADAVAVLQRTVADQTRTIEELRTKPGVAYLQRIRMDIGT